MTGFDISANPQGAVAAAKAVVHSLEEIQRAVKAVNGEMSKLAPGMRGQAVAMERDLSSVINSGMGRTFQQALQSSGQAGISPLMADMERVYPSSRSAGQRSLRQMARHRGYKVDEEAGGQGGGGGEDEGGGGGGGMGAAAGRMGGMVKGGLALVGLSLTIGTLLKGLSAAEQQSVQVDTLFRTLGRVGTTFEGVQDEVEKFGKGLGLAQAESVRLMQAFASAANITDAVRLGIEGRQAAGLARAFGMSPDQAGGQFGAMRFLGQGGAGPGGSRELAMMITDAIGKSGLLAKPDEVVAALMHFTQTASTYLVEAAPTKQFAELYATLNASGKPGFMGQNAENLISRMDSAFRQGGGSEATKVFYWRALNESDPYKFRYDLAGGLFDKDKGGRANLDKVMDYFNANTKNMPFFQRASTLADIFPGMNARQAGGLLNLDLTSNGGIGGLAQFMNKIGVDPANMQPDSYKLMAQIQSGGMGDLEDIRKQLMKDSATTPEQRAQLNSLTPENAQSVLGQIAASNGRIHTTASDTLEATAIIKDTLLKIGGEVLDIRNIMAISAGGAIRAAIGGLHEAGSAMNKASVYGTTYIPSLGPDSKSTPPLGDQHSYASMIDAIHNPAWVMRWGPAQSAPPNYFSRNSGDNGEAQPAGQPNLTVY